MFVCYSIGHGIGRSGNITDIQPKAAGSSIMMKLTNSMVTDIIRHAGDFTGLFCNIVTLYLVRFIAREHRSVVTFILAISNQCCFLQ